MDLMHAVENRKAGIRQDVHGVGLPRQWCAQAYVERSCWDSIGFHAPRNPTITAEALDEGVGLR